MMVERPVPSLAAPLYQPKGDCARHVSISVSGNWRLTFDIREDEICNLDLEDYH